MLKRIVKMFTTKRIRENLFWNLKRIIVEHLYDYELQRLSYLVDTRQTKEAKKLSEVLQKTSNFLQPAAIRLDTISDFINGED